LKGVLAAVVGGMSLRTSSEQYPISALAIRRQLSLRAHHPKIIQGNQYSVTPDINVKATIVVKTLFDNKSSGKSLSHKENNTSPIDKSHGKVSTKCFKL
jgi:hypothetical protein